MLCARDRCFCGLLTLCAAACSAGDRSASAATQKSFGSAQGAFEPSADADIAQPTATVAGLKIAFFGDQGVGSDARSVLQLIASEHADAVVHLGDFAYDEASPADWEGQISSVLGADFPYFAVIGNHDVAAWPGQEGFAAQVRARLARIPDAHCSGDYGVNARCSFRGLDFVLSGVGTYGADHESFLEESLSHSAAIFRLCLWHKNQHDMQVGAKTDEVGWEAYRICARHGAAVITGHEHSYARSLTLAAVGEHAQGHGALGDPAQIELEPGRTFVAVSGLGGQSARVMTPEHRADSWWASIYAGDRQLENGTLQGTAPSVLYGALFIEFNVDGDPHMARGYFMTVDGQRRDEFTLLSRSAG